MYDSAFSIHSREVNLANDGNEGDPDGDQVMHSRDMDEQFRMLSGVHVEEKTRKDCLKELLCLFLYRWTYLCHPGNVLKTSSKILCKYKKKDCIKML